MRPLLCRQAGAAWADAGHLLTIGEPPALLRNRIQWDQLKSEISCLHVKPCCFLMLPALLLLLKDSGIVFLLCRDHVVNDSGEFVRSSRHCFWGAHSCFHAPEVVAQKCVAAA